MALSKDFGDKSGPQIISKRVGSALDIGQVSAAKGQKLKAQSKVENTYEKRCLTQRRKDAKKMTENEIAKISD